CTRFLRVRIGELASSAKKKAAAPTAAMAMIKSMASTSEGDDFLEDQGTDGHLPEPREHQLLAHGGWLDGVHEVTVDQRDASRQQERDGNQRVGGHASHCGERTNLARELLPLPDGVGDHVEQRRQRAADLT